MAFDEGNGGWRLLREKANGSDDTDWVGTATAPAGTDTASMSFAVTRGGGDPTRLSVVVLALNGGALASPGSGTFDLELVEVVPRSVDPVGGVPISRGGVVQDVPLAQVQTWQVSGMAEFSVRLSGGASLPTLDAVEVWYRVERT